MSVPDVIRTPNHLGDFIMALPALEAAPSADIIVPRWLVPLAAQLQRDGSVIPFDRGRAGMLAAVRLLRRGSHRTGVLLPPSFSSALMLRMGGVRHLRGLPTDGRRLLLREIVPLARVRQHRTQLYLELVGGAPRTDVAPRLPVPGAVREQARARLGGPHPRVAVFPGSNAPARRWPAERFAAVVRDLATDGLHVIVLGGAGEAELTARVAGDVALDLGGRTDLPALAATLAECDILVTNDSGPMHLAAAVGTPVLVVSGPADTKETGPHGPSHTYLQRLDLPCVPCVRNTCPRRGAGFILAEAEQECLRLIEVRNVVEAARRMLGK